MYIEYVFIENLIINYFILKLCHLANKEKSKLTILFAFVGSFVATVMPFFAVTTQARIIIQIFTSIAMVLMAFKWKGVKYFFKNSLLFFMITFVFGGAVMVFEQNFGQLNILWVLLILFILFILTRFFIKFVYKKKVVENFLTSVKICDGNNIIEEKGFFDSGNLLYDPITSKPIALITHEVFSKLYGTDSVSIFLKKIDETKLKNGHYINVNSAIKGGKMLVFSVDKIIVEGERIYEDVCLGLSFSGFEKAMHSQVLLHSSQGY